MLHCKWKAKKKKNWKKQRMEIYWKSIQSKNYLNKRTVLVFKLTLKIETNRIATNRIKSQIDLFLSHNISMNTNGTDGQWSGSIAILNRIHLECSLLFTAMWCIIKSTCMNWHRFVLLLDFAHLFFHSISTLTHPKRYSVSFNYVIIYLVQ